MILLRDRVLLVAFAAALGLVGVGGWLVLDEMSGGGAAPAAETGVGLVATSGSVSASTSQAPTELVVDVEGGVERPGIIELPDGTRVADAIRAAGGYSDVADLAAAASALNLAALLTDGAQVIVPVLGSTTSGTGVGAGGGDAAGGLVDLNHATPEALDALPGIGPVTVQKIVAARTERPFASLEEAVERGALNNGQLDKIRDLATVR